MNGEGPVFVVGCPRSGTTLFHHTLLSAGGFTVYRCESHAFDILGPRFGNLATPADRAEFLDAWLGSEFFLRSGLEEEEVRRRVTAECRSTADFLRILMEGMCARQGARRWVETTPAHVLYMRQIAEAFPDARFVHLIRDGRDVAVSLSKQGWIRRHPWDRGPATLAAAAFWAWNVDRGRTAGRALPGRYSEVRFGDLLTRPRETLERVGTFLGHDLDYDRIRRVGVGTVGSPNTSFEAELEEGGFRPIERWRDAYSDRELRTVEGLIGPQLLELGYELGTGEEPGRVPMLRRIDHALYRTRFTLRSWLKSRVPPLRRRVDTSLLDGPWPPEDDPTVRPGENLALVREIVASGD